MEDGYARLGLDVLNRMRGLHPEFYEAMAYAWLYHMSPRADEQPIEIVIDQPGEPGSLGDPPTPGGFYVLHYEDADGNASSAQQLFGDSMTMFPESSWHDFIVEYLLAPSDQSTKAQVIEVIGDTLASYLDWAIYYSYDYGTPFSVDSWHRAMATTGYRFVGYDPYGAVINRNRR